MSARRSTLEGRSEHGGTRKQVRTVSPPLAKAVALHLDGKREEALAELNAAIDQGQETIEVFAAKAHVEFELDRFEDAVGTYERLLVISPHHVTANFNVAICYEKLGRWVEASDGFRHALEGDPDRLDAQLGLGICLLHQEKPEPALESFDRCWRRRRTRKRPSSARRWRCSCCGSSMKPRRSTSNSWNATPRWKSVW